MKRIITAVLIGTSLVTTTAMGQVPCATNYVPFGTYAVDWRLSAFVGAGICPFDQPNDQDQTLALALTYEHFDIAINAGVGFLGSTYGKDADRIYHLNINYRVWGGPSGFNPISLHLQPGLALLRQEIASGGTDVTRNETRIPLKFYLNFIIKEPFDDPDLGLLDNTRVRAWIGPLLEWAQVEIAGDAETKVGWGYSFGGAVEFINRFGISISIEHERVGFENRPGLPIQRRIKRWTIGAGLYLMIGTG